ncbi:MULTISPECIES: alpha/beta fold hydrolase [Hyphobacterium]|uniref:Alpha/beta fold hydrolase n=1 Tax=Hyphobacterium vulgare TaxID=1736751 RepID=A0ABV7A0C8_9PROT
MTRITINGADLFVSDSGGSGTPILFIHGLMLASQSWEAQIARFSAAHRVVAFDLRGQGQSEKTRDRLDLDSLAEDAGAVIDRLKLGRVHVVAFSMGTFIALRLAAWRPEIVRSLTLIGPSADAEEPANLPRYRLLIALVRMFGTRVAIGPMMKILFGDTYLANAAAKPARERWRRELLSLPRSLHRAAAASASREAVDHLLSSIRMPTLIVSGDEDRPISPERAFRVHQGIAGSRFVPVARAGHAVMIEHAEAFNGILEDFLAEVEALDADTEGPALPRIP